MENNYYSGRVDTIWQTAQDELILLIKKIIFEDDTETDKLLTFDKPIELGGDDSICKHYTCYNKIMLADGFVYLHNSIDDIWEDIEVLTLNELYEFITMLLNYNHKNLN